MPQYILTNHWTRAGITFAQGTVLSTDVPEHGLFHISPQEAERLQAEGWLQPHTPAALTGARSREPGWRKVERYDYDGENPWG